MTVTNFPLHTRRRLMQAAAFAAGGLACNKLLHAQNGDKPEQAAKAGVDHRTALHHEIELKATPTQVQDVLLDDKKFSKLTKLAATIDPKEGGAFSLFGGLIVGRNIEIVSAMRVVQAWRPSHWEPGLYSMARFALTPHGAGTLVTLDHTGFPEGDYEHLFSGWYAHYWEPLKALFG